MKKIIILSVSVAIFLLAVSVSFAASVSFSPATISVKERGAFNVSVFINPQSEKNYSFKLGLKYPSDLIEVKSFSFKDGWVQLSQSGYDLIDNTNGILLKTAGYPGGISQNTLFGIVSFKAIKSGTGIIKLGQESLSFNANSQNVLTNYSTQASVNITAEQKQKVIQEANVKQNLTEEYNEVEQPAVKNIEQAKGIQTGITEATETSAVEPITISHQVPKISLLASIGKTTKNIMVNFSDSIIGLIILVVIIVIFVAVGVLYKKKKQI